MGIAVLRTCRVRDWRRWTLDRFPLFSIPSFAKTENGQVWGWGQNLGGFLGVSGSNIRSAKRLPIPTTDIKMVQAGCEGAQIKSKTYTCSIWALSST